MITKFKNIIFDLDGTLIDSSDDITECLQKSYKDCNIEHKSIDKTFIGPPLAEIIKNVSPDIQDNQLNQLVKKFRKYYDSSSLINTKLYDGVYELLENFAKNDIKMFIATNKPLDITQKILGNLGLGFFSDIIANDSEWGLSLNKIDMLAILIRKWSLLPEITLMVGDSASDIMAAKKNNLSSVAVLSGYGDAKSLIKSRPDYILDEIKLLFNLKINA